MPDSKHQSDRRMTWGLAQELFSLPMVNLKTKTPGGGSERRAARTIDEDRVIVDNAIISGARYVPQASRLARRGLIWRGAGLASFLMIRIAGSPTCGADGAHRRRASVRRISTVMSESPLLVLYYAVDGTRTSL